MGRRHVLSIGLKLKLAYALFLVPLVFLFFVTVNDATSSNDLTRRELVGSDYVAALTSIENDVAISGPSAAPALAIGGAERRFGAGLGTKAAAAKAEASFGARNSATAATSAVRLLIGSVADKSGLTLDPDLASFYVQDVITTKLPDLIVRVAALGDLAEAHAGKPTLSPAEQADALVQVGELRSAIDGLEASLTVAIAADRSRRSGEPLAATRAIVARTLPGALTNLSDAATEPGGRPVEAINQLTRLVLTSLRQVAEPSTVELNRLLQARIDRTLQRLWLNIGFAATLFLIGVVFVIIAVERGAIMPLRHLTQVLHLLAKGDTQARIEDTQRGDEVGAITRAAQAFHDSLVRTQRLEAAAAESERRHRSFYNWTPVPLIASDRNGLVVAVSDRWLELMGYERDDVIGRNISQFLTPDSAKLRLDVISARPYRSKSLYELDLRNIRKDGEIVDVHSVSTVTIDAETGDWQILSFEIDQTVRYRLARALAQTERDLRAILENAPIAISLRDRAGRYRLFNQCFENWIGTPADPPGDVVEHYLPADQVAQERQTDREVLEAGTVLQSEYPELQWRERRMALLITKFPIRDADGAIDGVCSFLTDITSIRRAEERLKQTRQLLIDSQRLGRLAYISRSMTTGEVIWSDTMYELRRTSPAELGPLTAAESLRFTHPDDLAIQDAAHDAAMAAHQDYVVDVRAFRGDGTVGWERRIGRPRFGPDGSPLDMLILVRDITETRQAEEERLQSETRFRALIEHSSDMLAVLGADWVTIYSSPSWIVGSGLPSDQIEHRPLFDFVHPDDVDALREALTAVLASPAGKAAGRSRLRHTDGFWRHIAWSASNARDVPGVNGIILNTRDVTVEVTLEEQLQQAHKLEAIGQLAGGIAHDFNNVIGAILGFAGFLLQDLPAKSPEHLFAERIAAAGRRARDLVQQILTFARKGSIKRVETDLVPILREVRDLLHASLPSSTEMIVETPDDPLIADVNPTQITQLLVNLGVNANDALNGRAGQVTVSITRVEPDHEDHAWFAERVKMSVDTVTVIGALDPSHAYARLSVADTGDGIAPDVLTRVFDPFFTTKGPGKGTGLGLAVVHGIVLGYDGACVVESIQGGGTTFWIYLRLAATAAARPVTGADRQTGGIERVLVVDDEPFLTEMLAIGLGRQGYAVTAMNDPLAALSRFEADPSAFDVVISDQAMPGMTGLTLLDRIQAIRPAMPFILCSGFSDGATEESAAAAGARAFLVKPISIELLAGRIRELDGVASGASC